MLPNITLIEYRLAQEFNYRANIIVPNIWWGIEGIGHECDLLILRASGYAVEVEIKRSIYDLKQDLKKTHGHFSYKIRELWFCVSAEWDENKINEYVPPKAGIITYTGERSILLKKRYPVINKLAKKFCEIDRNKLLHLAHMRIWTMKRQKVNTLRNTNG